MVDITTPLANDIIPMAVGRSGVVTQIYTTAASLAVGVSPSVLLTSAVSATDTTIPVTSLPVGSVANGIWAVIDPGTIECEVKQVTNISTLDLTVSALAFAHAASDPILYVYSPEIQAAWFGAPSTTALQRAVTAAAGSKLTLPRGTTYTIDTGITTLDNIEIDANHAVVKYDAVTAINMFLVSSKSNVVFRNLEIDGNKANMSGDGRGIVIVAGSNILIDNCYIHDCADAGIFAITSLADSRITGCRIIDCGESGASNGKGIYLKDAITDTQIDHNRVNGAYGDGILVASDGDNIARVVIDNNTVKDCGAIGIYLAGDASHYISSSTITGNTVTGCTTDGIELAYGADCSMTGNTGNLNDVDGIVLDHCLRCATDGNTGNGNGARGINLQNSSYGTVTGNTAWNNDTGANGSIAGIDLYETSLYNTVVGNNCGDDGGATQDYGIGESATANHNLIEGNIVVGNVTAGVHAQGANTIVRQNKGWVTESSGIAVMDSANTTEVVTHGCSVTPDWQDVLVNFGPGGGGTAKVIYCSSISATELTFTVDAAPGADKSFVWQVHAL